MHRVGFACLGVIAWLALSVPAAHACSCGVDPDAPPETIDGYDAAVTARLVDVKRVGNDRQRLTYEVLRAYKGNLDEGDDFRETNYLNSSCGIPSNKGKRYGLRLNRFRGQLNASSCSKFGPKSLRKAAERSSGTRAAGTSGCGGSAANA
jgi:hypothetical protein